jgi:ribosomal protein S18 acetylase RimI-like enzyme
MTAVTPPTYPRAVRLADTSAVTLRLMGAADATRLVAFARGLASDDLLFLPTDITDPEVVAQWVKSLEAGLATTVLAEAGGGDLAGYAALVTSRVSWQRHLGVIRLHVGPRHRGKGLGRTLAAEVFLLGRQRGLRKIVAQMTPDQTGAIGTFERLGFRPEALLQDYVLDGRGRTRDLLVMTYDVTGLTDDLD